MPRLPEDTSHLGGSASLGRSIKLGEVAPGVRKAVDLSRVAKDKQAASLFAAIHKGLHRIAGLVHRGDLDRAAKVARMVGNMTTTYQAIMAEIAAQEPDKAKDDPLLSTRLPSRSKPKRRAGYGSKPGFGTKTGKAWRIER